MLWSRNVPHDDGFPWSFASLEELLPLPRNAPDVIPLPLGKVEKIDND